MPNAVKVCRTCGEEFLFYPGKPGYINECDDCTLLRGEVPKLRATPDGDNWVPMPENKLPGRSPVTTFMNTREDRF